MVFASGKAKGEHEYLITYGPNPSNVFTPIALSTLSIAILALEIVVAGSDRLQIAFRGHISPRFAELTTLYSVPTIYATAVFTTVARTPWSSLATQRMGVNSPVGIAPALGIIPILAVLKFGQTQGKKISTLFPWHVRPHLFAFIILAKAIAALSTKKLNRERSFSNAWLC